MKTARDADDGVAGAFEREADVVCDDEFVFNYQDGLLHSDGFCEDMTGQP